MIKTPEPVMPEIDFAMSEVRDLEIRLRQLADDGHDIAPVRWQGGIAWLVLGYDNVFKAMSDDRRIPSAPEYIDTWKSQGPDQPLKQGGIEHLTTRKYLEPSFKPGAVRRLIEPMLEPLADRLIDEFGDRRELDILAHYTRRYAFLVISALLGVPIDHDNERRIMELVYATLIEGKQAMAEGETLEERHRTALEAAAEMNAYLKPIIDARRAKPEDDIISYFLTEEKAGKSLPEETICSYIRFLYQGGAETTATAMGHLLKNILSDREIYQRLLDHPEDRSAAIEESLRYTPPVNMVVRLLEKDTEICGRVIPAGSKILFSVGSGNRDPKIFSHPDSYFIDQKRKPVLSFGMGPHFCMGSHLAKAELAVSLNKLLERLPGLRLAEEAPDAIGAVFRWLPELKVRFDDIIPV